MPGPLIVPLAGRPLCPRCMAGWMRRHGQRKRRRRYLCPSCGASRTEGCAGRWCPVALRLVRTPAGWLLAEGEDGLRVSVDGRGRRRVLLGRGHPWANSAGWQYLYRFVVADSLGRALLTAEQVHHRNGDHADDQLHNLEALHVEYHGRLHAWAMTFAGRRGPDGRFRELEEESDFNSPRPIERWGAVLGAAARYLQRERERARA